MQTNAAYRAATPRVRSLALFFTLFAGAFAQPWSGGGFAAAQNAAAPASTQPAPGKPQSVAEKIAASQQLLDINTATAEQLKALPGMGAEYANRVIAGRPYTAKNQLATRGILPKEEYERIRELIIAHRRKAQ